MDTTTPDPPWLSIIGLGLAGWAELAAPARQAVIDAEYIIGGARHLAMLPDTVSAERRAWPNPFQEGIDAILARRDRRVAVLATGDPFWFGVGATLTRYVSASEIQSWPAPSAFSLAANRLGWALQNVACVSVHGRALTRLVPALADGARILALSWNGDTPAAIARFLCERGLGASRLTVLAELGGPGEQRLNGRAAAWPASPVADLNVVAIDCVAGPDAVPASRAAGLADHWYLDRTAASAATRPVAQVTKREVRAAVLALLAPARRQRLWDIGAGSGSIAIEWLRSGHDRNATAVETRADRRALIRANAERLGTPDLEIVAGRAPEALASLSGTPDAIFIGGGLTAPGLLAACMTRLAPGGRVVASSVTLEGDAVLLAARERYGGTLRRLSVSRAAPLGGFHGWQALRPVTLWCSHDDEDMTGPS